MAGQLFEYKSNIIRVRPREKSERCYSVGGWRWEKFNSWIIPLDSPVEFLYAALRNATKRKYHGKFKLISEKMETSPIIYHCRKIRHEIEFLHVITLQIPLVLITSYLVILSRMQRSRYFNNNESNRIFRDTCRFFEMKIYRMRWRNIPPPLLIKRYNPLKKKNSTSRWWNDNRTLKRSVQ